MTRLPHDQVDALPDDGLIQARAGRLPGADFDHQAHVALGIFHGSSGKRLCSRSMVDQWIVGSVGSHHKSDAEISLLRRYLDTRESKSIRLRKVLFVKSILKKCLDSVSGVFSPGPQVPDIK